MLEGMTPLAVAQSNQRLRSIYRTLRRHKNAVLLLLLLLLLLVVVVVLYIIIYALKLIFFTYHLTRALQPVATCRQSP